ncbi:MAG: hypothetical protein IPL48_07385 [Bacteroidetes bacterium]|nr:hypothetical protein [Bacteroidota bacterium]
MSELLCPKCGSDKLTANKKGFSMGKAIAGDLIAGIPGALIGGSLGSKKIKITCLNCGHEFKPGEGATSQSDFQKKKKDKATTGIFAAVVLVIIICWSMLDKSCGGEKNKSTITSKKASIYIDNPSPEMQKFPQDVALYETALIDLNNYAQQELNKFDDKWLSHQVVSVKGFKEDINNIQTFCTDTKTKFNELTSPSVPSQLGGESTNVLWSKSKDKIAKGYINLSFYYSYIAKAEFESDDPEFWVEQGKKAKQKGIDLIQEGFDDLKKTKNDFQLE